LLDGPKLTAKVGTVLSLDEAPRAHEMLAGAPHKRGKIVLTMHGAHWIRRLMLANASLADPEE